MKDVIKYLIIWISSVNENGMLISKKLENNAFNWKYTLILDDMIYQNVSI